MTDISNRRRKSESLTPAEFRAFKKWVGDQPTKLDAAVSLGVAPNTIDRILLAGSGAPDNIEKIRLKINPSHAA